MKSFSSLVKEISRIGGNIHSVILERAEIDMVSLSLISDTRNGAIVLRLEMNVFSNDPDFIIFENDIINIQTKNDLYTLDCKLYSEFGIDNIMALDGNLNNLDPLIFNKLESDLIEKIMEHVEFFQS